jgi:hypothetical protein
LIGGQRFELRDHRQGAGQGQHRIPPGGQKHKRADPPPSSPASRCIQQQRLPGMLQIRPRGQAAYGAGARVLRVDDSAPGSILPARACCGETISGSGRAARVGCDTSAQAVIVE